PPTKLPGLLCRRITATRLGAVPEGWWIVGRNRVLLMIQCHARCRAKADNSNKRGAQPKEKRSAAPRYALITARSAQRKENGQERRGGGKGNRAGRKAAAFVRILPSLYFVLYG